MNHDYAHCLDYTPDCPRECFRAQLTKELAERKDLIGMFFSWAHLEGTEECAKEKRGEADDQ